MGGGQQAPMGISETLLALQTGIIFISVVVAWLTFRDAQKHTRYTSTINQITGQKSNERFIASYYAYRDMVNANFDFTNLLNIKDYKEKRRDVSYVLNHYEFIALCIKRKAFDERLYKELQGDNIIDMYHTAQGFIKAIWQKEKNTKTFEGLVWLIETKWCKEYENYKRGLKGTT